MNEYYAPDAKVLVVDDNELNLKVILGLLELSMIKAKTASCGKDAIEMVLQSDFDIIFIDHRMPEMDGLETVAHIRNLRRDYGFLPVVALTAHTFQGAKEFFLSKGFDDYITKPVSLQRLNETLLLWLSPDKIIRVFADQNDDFTDSTAFMKNIARIGAIDAKAGISLVCGREELYRENLEFFHKDLLSRCDAMRDQLNGENLSRFFIDAHSMKSALATIGATGLSGIAAMLEAAAGNNDIILCASIFPGFYKELIDLRADLSGFFASEIIRKAIIAADGRDSELGLELLNSLLADDFLVNDFDAGIIGLLNEAYADFDGFMYDNAKGVLAKALEKVCL